MEAFPNLKIRIDNKFESKKPLSSSFDTEVSPITNTALSQDNVALSFSDIEIIKLKQGIKSPKRSKRTHKTKKTQFPNTNTRFEVSDTVTNIDIPNSSSLSLQLTKVRQENKELKKMLKEKDLIIEKFVGGQLPQIKNKEWPSSNAESLPLSHYVKNKDLFLYSLEERAGVMKDQLKSLRTCRLGRDNFLKEIKRRHKNSY